MKRRSARTVFSTAQLALWGDEPEAGKPVPAAAPPAASARGPHPSAPPPGPVRHAVRGGAR
jgi:hypothetical protein